MKKKNWTLEPELRESLFAAVPDIIASQNKEGQFGDDPWICQDQNVLLALACSWSLSDSPYHHDEKVMDSIVRGGYALIDAQDDEGMWTFRKKDHSTWGQIYMPWTYSRWIRAYLLVRDAMPAKAKKRWDKGLTLGYEGISKTCLDHVHNIPAHDAMGLQCAGMVFERDEWCRQASQFLSQVMEKQSDDGWWSENSGPVVTYNMVYMESLGVYYALSGDKSVMPALEKGARFHANFVYPDGTMVETIDERVPFHNIVRLGNPGFSYTPAGRGFVKQQHAHHMASKNSNDSAPVFESDYAANMLLYCEEGEIEDTGGSKEQHAYRMGDGTGEAALVVRTRPWFVAMSAYTAKIPDSRWIQDRQNFLSIYHDSIGLIIGGGNTKLQPLWSSFTVGDISELTHTAGIEEPNFFPTGDLLHVPDKASISEDTESPTLTLQYGRDIFDMTTRVIDNESLELTYEHTAQSGTQAEAHIILLVDLAQPAQLWNGDTLNLAGQEACVVTVTGGEGWIEHKGWRLTLPEGSRLVWPVLPHNPYRKVGESTPDEARLVAVLPFNDNVRKHSVILSL